MPAPTPRRRGAMVGRGTGWRAAMVAATCVLLLGSAAVEAAAGLKGKAGAPAIRRSVAAEANPYLGDDGRIAEGKALYRRFCYQCHRKTGGRGPNLRRTRLDDGAFLKTVLAGRRGNRGTMPAWRARLEPDDVWKIHAYVKDGLK